MDKSVEKTYYSLVFAQFFRAVSTFTFWMCAFLSVKYQGLPEQFIVPCFLMIPIISLVTDLPSGAYADRVSCKAALFVSGTFDLLAYTCLGLVSFHVAFAPIALLFKGLGASFENGAGGHLLYSTAGQLFGQPKGSQKSATHSEIINRFGSLLGGGVGAFVVHSSPKLPWLIAVAATSINLILVAGIHNPAHGTKRFSSLVVASQNIRANLGLAFTLAFAPIFLFKFADGFRTGTEGVTFVPFLSSILENKSVLAILPVIAFTVRMPIALLTLKGRIPIPKNPGVASCAVFATIGMLILSMAWVAHPIWGIVAATLNFILYSLRDIWSRHWENETVASLSGDHVTFRSALSTSMTAAQLLGTALLTGLAGIGNTNAWGLMLGGLIPIAAAGLAINLKLTDSNQINQTSFE